MHANHSQGKPFGPKECHPGEQRDGNEVHIDKINYESDYGKHGNDPADGPVFWFSVKWKSWLVVVNDFLVKSSVIRVLRLAHVVGTGL